MITPFRILIIRVTLSTTAQPLGKLVKAAYAAKSLGAWPSGRPMKAILYASDATVSVKDALTGDGPGLAATTRTTFEGINILDNLNLVASAGTPTVDVEIYFGE